MACGWIHNVALRSDGTVVTWPPTTSFNGRQSWGDVVAIAGKNQLSAALREDGTLLTWWGSEVSARRHHAPGDGMAYVAVACGTDHMVALKRTPAPLD
mmetsp:Transcript_12853/g.41984  ORF Transcript_12853/g.41984 Transcript_12853/m.41984 type:complete len:98 (-) Transcript_12853:831-1124(-)